MQSRLVRLDGQEVFGPAIHDGLCHIWVASDRVDAHQRPLEMAAGRQPREQRRDGSGLVRLLRASLLAEHQALVGGERRNQMQSLTPGFAVMLLLTPSLERVFLSGFSSLHQNSPFRALIVIADVRSVLMSS